MILALLLAATLTLVAGEAGAASFALAEADRQAAIEAGERSTTVEGFGAEWRVSADGASATVVTPFHRLAVAARHAAFRGAPLKPADVDRTLKQDAGRLVVWVQLRGRSEDFARQYAPRLQAGDREIKAAFVQNERTAIRGEDGGFVARCVYAFPVRDLTGRERVELTVVDAGGRPVSRFSLDLAAMR